MPGALASKTVLAVWIGACAIGMWQLALHVGEPGAVGTSPTTLPHALGQQLHWHGRQPLLVMAVHPQCPCVPNSFDELEAIVAAEPKLTVRILSYEPSSKPPEWQEGALDPWLNKWPAETTLLDQDGQLAAQLGAKTSGHIVLYQPDRSLSFAGGITDARGHKGTTASRRALQRALNAPVTEPVRTSVFGCPIHTPCDCTSDLPDSNGTE